MEVPHNPLAPHNPLVPSPVAPYSPLAVANYFIEQAGSEGVDHLKLQQLVYCAQGWWLYTKGLDNPLIEEDIKAMKHGPAILSLYHTLRVYGWELINEPISTSPVEKPPQVTKDDDKEFLSWVWKRYIALDGWGMSALTHARGTPWHDLVEQYGYPPPKEHCKIDKSRVQEEFRNISSRFIPSSSD